MPACRLSDSRRGAGVSARRRHESILGKAGFSWPDSCKTGRWENSLEKRQISNAVLNIVLILI
jgi:hypothetical protein